MATGVLVVGINKATRLLTYIVGTSKTYTATIRLGESTITDDAEGDVIATVSAAAVADEAIHDGVTALTGDIQQVPSSVSAIKVNGERAYARVRSGEEVKLAARPVTIHRFEVHGIRRERGSDVIDIDVTVECSSGTYIRALARDLGDGLGVGGHLTALRRTHVGPYSLDQARTLEQLAEELTVLEMSQAARALMPNRELTVEETTEISFGRRIAAGAAAGSPGAATAEHPAAAFAPDGSLVALLAMRAISPSRYWCSRPATLRPQTLPAGTRRNGRLFLHHSCGGPALERNLPGGRHPQEGANDITILSVAAVELALVVYLVGSIVG